MVEQTYISLYGKTGRIHFYKKIIWGLGEPKFIRFLLNADGRLLVEPYNRITLTSFRVPARLKESSKMEVSSMSLVRILYRQFNFDTNKSYRIKGQIYSETQKAVFDIATAEQI